MKLHQKIRINESGKAIVNALNSGTKHEQYTGRIVCKSGGRGDWLVEIDQPGVDTFKTATAGMFTELDHVTDKAFVYLHESCFELI